MFTLLKTIWRLIHCLLFNFIFGAIIVLLDLDTNIMFNKNYAINLHLIKTLPAKIANEHLIDFLMNV